MKKQIIFAAILSMAIIFLSGAVSAVYGYWSFNEWNSNPPNIYEDFNHYAPMHSRAMLIEDRNYHYVYPIHVGCGDWNDRYYPHPRIYEYGHYERPVFWNVNYYIR